MICSAKSVDKEAHRHFSEQGFFLPETDYAKGYVLTVANLADCRPMTREDEPEAWSRYAGGLYAWCLEKRREIRPFKVVGRQRLFNAELKPIILMAEYCPGPFYMGWWLYERDRPDGSRNDWGGWGWLRDARSQQRVWRFCEKMGHRNLPRPERYSQDFAEAFGKKFPGGLTVSRLRDGENNYKVA